MTASPGPDERALFAWPIIDYEPPPIGAAPLCPPPTPAGLRRRTPRLLRPATVPVPVSVPVRMPPSCRELPPPRAAAVFADTALRRVLEVTDRRRPATQLRRLLAPSVYDAVLAHSAAPSSDGAAVLRRVRLRMALATEGEATAAELFATYTRAHRVRAIAGRIEIVRGGWLVVALQIG